MALRSHLLAAVGACSAGSALASPGAIPKHLRNLRASLKTLILPPRRSERRLPRAVKIKMSNHARRRRKGSK
jgi:hypothetical protein